MLDDLETKRKFAGLMTGLSDYYRQEISKSVLSIYFRALRPYEYEDIERAVDAHIINPETAGSFMPKANEIAKMIEGSTTDQSAIAWSKVDKAVRGVGPYKDVVFDDPIIHRVVGDMGGWVLMCSHDDIDWPFAGNEFKTRYKGYRMRGETPEYAPVLSGIANSHNEAEKVGMRFLPMLIGDESKCQAVMKGGSNAPLLQMRTASQLADVKLLQGE
jgi:hypothetical protein